MCLRYMTLRYYAKRNCLVLSCWGDYTVLVKRAGWRGKSGVRNHPEKRSLGRLRSRRKDACYGRHATCVPKAEAQAPEFAPFVSKWG